MADKGNCRLSGPTKLRISVAWISATCVLLTADWGPAIKVRLIAQHSGTSSSLAAFLGSLFRRFGQHESAHFRALVAFASAAGLRLIETRLRSFLERGHRAFWIVGVDMGGTGRQALQFLYDLATEFTDQMDLRVFTQGDNAHVFHPKVYWFDAPTHDRAVIVGSPNATLGGFRDNVEAAVEFRLTDVEDEELVRRFENLWITYSTPLPPFSQENLIRVDQAFIDRLPADDPPDNKPTRPHPLGRRLPHGTRRRRRRRIRTLRRGRELVQDVLQETRETQVQLPVGALQPFFAANQTVRLRYVRDGEVVKEDDRPLIHLPNNTHRIEIDAVRGLSRPQIIRFRRPAVGRGPVDYELILRGTSQYRTVDQLLDARGERTRRGSRRWLLQ